MCFLPAVLWCASQASGLFSLREHCSVGSVGAVQDGGIPHMAGPTFPLQKQPRSHSSPRCNVRGTTVVALQALTFCASHGIWCVSTMISRRPHHVHTYHLLLYTYTFRRAYNVSYHTVMRYACVPPFQLLTPPGFQATRLPRANLAVGDVQWYDGNMNLKMWYSSYEWS